MKKVIRIDENGFFIEEVLIDETEPCPSDCIETVCANGFYFPKWNGSDWIEGLSPEQIEEIKKRPHAPSLQEQLDAQAKAISALMGV